MSAGGLKPASPPDQDVEAITTLIRPLYERDSGKQVAMFKPVMYRTQMVAGVLYFIKVLVEEGNIPKCVHLKVFRELDPQKLVFSLSSFQEEKALDSPIESF